MNYSGQHLLRCTGKYHCTVHRLLFLLALHEWKCSGLNLEANSRETCGEKGTTPPAIAQHNAAKTALRRLLAQSLGLGRVVVEKLQKHFWRIRLRFQTRLPILFPRGLKMLKLSIETQLLLGRTPSLFSVIQLQNACLALSRLMFDWHSIRLTDDLHWGSQSSSTGESALFIASHVSTGNKIKFRVGLWDQWIRRVSPRLECKQWPFTYLKEVRFRRQWLSLDFGLRICPCERLSNKIWLPASLLQNDPPTQETLVNLPPLNEVPNAHFHLSLPVKTLLQRSAGECGESDLAGRCQISISTAKPARCMD